MAEMFWNFLDETGEVGLLGPPVTPRDLLMHSWLKALFAGQCSCFSYFCSTLQFGWSGGQGCKLRYSSSGSDSCTPGRGKLCYV